MSTDLDIDRVREAAARIRGEVHATPVLTSRHFDRRTGCSLFFKCENFQRVGAFKFRGASNAVRSLRDEQAARGVVTHSSGNHGQALALAARRRGIRAWVVMPENAPAVKRRAVEGYGAEIVPCAPTLEARESTARDVIAETGAAFVHPYDDERIVAGQGTAALELIEQVGALDAVIAPVGGGGLLAGTCLAVHGLLPAADVLGAEPAGADDAHRSLAAGRLLPVEAPDTIADGLRTSLSPLTFSILQAHVASIPTVSDAETVAAMRTVFERMKIVIEPSAAVAVAALLRVSEALAGRRVGVILSGGNADLTRLPWA